MADPRNTAKSLGPYELERELVKSSWGSLFVGRISEGPEEGKPVAVRRVELSEGRDPALLEHAASAARHSLELRHLNVARVIDVLETEEGLSVVSEYVDAVPLSSVMRACSARSVQMPTPVALRIALDVLAGLGAAHRMWSTLGEEAQWFFGGLEPTSVLITKTGNVRVFDLGVAACLVGDDLEAETLVYRAPERLDSTRRFDARAGVYSVGVLLWEMLANRRLFPSMLTAPPQVVASSLPEGVSGVVARALARQPSERFASADEMAEELRALPSEESARAQDVVAFLHRVRSDSTRPPPSGSDSADEVRIPKPPRLPGSLPASEERAANPVLDKPQAAELDMPTVPKKSATKKAKHSSTSKPKSTKLAKVGLSARRAAAANMTVKAEVDAPASTRPASRRRALVAAAAVAALIVAVGLLRLLGGF